MVVEFGLAQLFVTSLVRLNQTICSDCLTNFIYDVLGGHHGHFAEVSFRWNYEAQSAPTLFILHEGRVVYFGQMVFRSADSNADDQGNKDTSDFEDEDFYELKESEAKTLASEWRKLTEEESSYDILMDLWRHGDSG